MTFIHLKMSENVVRLNKFKNKGKDANVSHFLDELRPAYFSPLLAEALNILNFFILTGAPSQESGGKRGAQKSEERRSDLQEEECVCAS